VIVRAFEGVLFDLDDTLHDDTTTYRSAASRVAQRIAAEYGVSATALLTAYTKFAEAFWGALGDEHLNLSLKGVRERMWADTLASVGIDGRNGLAERAAAEYNRFRGEGLQLYPGVLPLLHDLRASGRRIGLITNGFAETHREKIASLQLERAFDAVVLADEVGMVKPDPRIFLYACELVGTLPASTVMVGDRYDRDIAGALEAGLATIWLNPSNEPVPAGAASPDVVVRSFEGVAEALRRSLV